MKRLKMIKPHSDGGINMVDVESMFLALKASWVYRIIEADTNTDSWVHLAHFFVKILRNPEVNIIILYSLWIKPLTFLHLKPYTHFIER